MLVRWVHIVGATAVVAVLSLLGIAAIQANSPDEESAKRGDRLLRVTRQLILPVVVVWVLAGSWAQARARVARGGQSQAGPASDDEDEPEPFDPPTHPVILPRVQSRAMPDARVGQLVPIELVRELLGPPPRQFDPAHASYLHVDPPAWLRDSPGRKDEQWNALRAQDHLRANGTVVWAALVQANNKAFELRREEVGGSVIWSLDPHFDARPGELRRIALECFELKGVDQADPQAAAFSRMLTSEVMRGQRLPVPSRFTAGRAVFHSSMLFTRKHLPEGYLSAALLPIFVDPAPTGSVLLVPAAYWPSSLLSQWKNDPEDE